MIRVDFDIKQKLSSFIAFVFIITLSLVLGWFSIKTSEEIIANIPNSEIANIDKRMQNYQKNIGAKKVLQPDQAKKNSDLFEK